MEGTGVGGAATMGTQQHRSLTRRLGLLPHLEEQLGAALVSLPGCCQGCCWDGGSHLGTQVCPSHLGGASLCAAVGGPTQTFVCTGTTGAPCTPKPTQGPAPRGHLQELPPSLVSTHSHQCWNMVPKAPCRPSRSVLGCGGGMGGGSREGLGASLGAGPLGTDTCHPASPRATPRSCREPWEASSAPWVSPAFVLQNGFSVVGKFPRMLRHELGTGKEPSPCTDPVSLPLLSPPLAVSPHCATGCHSCHTVSNDEILLLRSLESPHVQHWTHSHTT